MSVLAALLFLAALIATGSGLLAALVTSRAPTRVPSGFDALDAVFAGVALAFCVVGLLAMPLVELGVFSLWALTGLLAVTGGAGWWGRGDSGDVGDGVGHCPLRPRRDGNGQSWPACCC
ncbi:MAG: hypothetical protein R2851_18700 [Caldilineaceae bacterium]